MTQSKEYPCTKGIVLGVEKFKLMNDMMINCFMKFQYITNSPILGPLDHRDYYIEPMAPICTRNATRQLPIDKDIVLIRLMQWNGRDVIIPLSASPSI
jgi:hypothetical protein